MQSIWNIFIALSSVVFYHSIYPFGSCQAKDYKFQAHTPFYQLDLNGDASNENIVVKAKDGEVWINIYDPFKKEIKKFELHAKGKDAWAYRINFRKLSYLSKILIVHFYEGYNKYLQLKGTSRLYFITWDRNDLKTLSIHKGPVVWNEFAHSQRHYYKRNYKLSLFDFNKDGVKEVSIKHHLISKIYMYNIGGHWIVF